MAVDGRWIISGLLVLGLFFVAVTVGGERVAIVTPDEPTFEEVAAALYLEHHLGKRDGTRVGVLSESELQPSLWRRVVDRLRGRERFYDEPDVEVFFDGEREGNQEPASADSYVIRKSGRVIYLDGHRRAVIDAAHGLLQDHLEYRWYFPGELGEVVPERSLSDLGDFSDRAAPGFRSRQFSGLRAPESGDWAAYNRMEPPGGANRRYRFHHNIRRIFTPDLFDEHPEVFPVWNGERYRPPENDLNWQPCFGHPKTAEIAARAAGEFFERTPDAISFSVGMNDGNRICECELCQGLVDRGDGFRDKPDYSDLIFTFTNRVAALVEETHPDKYIGALAYHWAENTPSFPVHPRVIPYLTADRSQWIDDRFRNEDRDLIRRWAEAGPEKLGIYDYYYGESFVIPRVFNEVMAESVRYAYDAGVRGFYAELYPRWSLDGPKAWLAAQLTWNPEADPELLLEDYYENFFGPAAGPMREYFEFAETRWASQVGRPYWLRYYFQIAQMELYSPEVCAEARVLLDRAGELAGEEAPYGDRVALFAEGFRLTELYSRYYHFIRNLTAGAELSEEEGWRLIVDLLLCADAFRDLVRWKDTVMDGDFRHREGGERFYDRIGFKPEMRLVRLVPALLAWGREYGAEDLVTRLLYRLDKVFPAARIGTARDVEAGAHSGRLRATNLLGNGNFGADLFLSGRDEYLGVRGRPPHDWNLWWRPGTRPGFFLSDNLSHRGSLALRAEGAVEEYAYVNVPVYPNGQYRFSAYAKGRIGNGGRVLIELLWWDSAGRFIDGDTRFVDQLPEGKIDEWSRLEVVGESPEGAHMLMAALAVSNQDEADWAAFDAVKLEEWLPAGTKP